MYFVRPFNVYGSSLHALVYTFDNLNDAEAYARDVCQRFASKVGHVRVENWRGIQLKRYYPYGMHGANWE